MGAAKGGPPIYGLHPSFKSVIGTWKSIIAFQVCQMPIAAGRHHFPWFSSENSLGILTEFF